MYTVQIDYPTTTDDPKTESTITETVQSTQSSTTSTESSLTTPSSANRIPFLELIVLPLIFALIGMVCYFKHSNKYKNLK
jgi:hypothetical protein